MELQKGDMLRSPHGAVVRVSQVKGGRYWLQHLVGRRWIAGRAWHPEELERADVIKIEDAA